MKRKVICVLLIMLFLCGCSKQKDDVLPERVKKEGKMSEQIKKENLYGTKIEKKEPAKVFKPTPIISPIYGVLDKNYNKDEMFGNIVFEVNITSDIDTLKLSIN